MRPQLIRTSLGLVALALLLRGPQAVAMDAGALPASTADAMAQAASPQAIAEYRRKLAEYQEVRGAFEQEAGAYWQCDLRQAARPQRQTARPSADRRRRLCADPAAGLCRAEAAGQSGAGAGTAASAARAQGYPGGRRSAAGRPAAIPVHAATAGERTRIQARLCPRRVRDGADARAGGAGLFVRDRRHRQLRRAVRHRAWRHPRHLHRDRLQPVAHHQQRRTGRRAGHRISSTRWRQRPRHCRGRRARRWTTRSRC